MESFSVEHDGDVALVTMLTSSMGFTFFDELPALFRELDADAHVRAIVLGGTGANFSFGLDLKDVAPMFAALTTGDAGASARTAMLAQVREWQASITAVADCRTPIISAILQRLVGIIGDGHLRELALIGDDIDSSRAERIGLVNSVYADAAALQEAALVMARTIAANAPLVVRGVKDVLDAERAPRVEAGLRYVAAWNSAFLPSRDLGEAFASFAEHRPAEFIGE
jgi:enoyl-CoA hydratase